MTGPATLVKTSIAAGATNTDAIVRKTGLPEPMVRLIVDELQRLGELVVDHIGYGCPTGTCGSCASESACGHSESTDTKPSVPVVIGERRSTD